MKTPTWTEENDTMIYSMFQDFYKNYISKDLFNRGLELYVTSTCNLNCEYCYLAKYEDDLYPKEFRDPKLILKNMKIFLNYLVENHMVFGFVDLFAGEIWHTDFGEAVLHVLLTEYIAKIDKKPDRVMIPTNGTFLKYPERVAKIEKYIRDFSFYNTNLTFSFSNDGLILDEINRPLKEDQEKYAEKEKYYDDLAVFCKKHGFGFHPMVNAAAIEKWPDNYKWWIDLLKKYNFSLLDNIMFLEVRNDEWTTEKILGYLKFLNTAFFYNAQVFDDGDLTKGIDDILMVSKRTLQQTNGNYYNLVIGRSNKKLSCTLPRTIIVRMGDLAWVPCHRTSYEKFVFGRFNVNENGKITGMTANNIPLLMSIHSSTYYMIPKCDICTFHDYCMRGCLGAQFEANKELLYPCETVCELYMAKNIYLFELAEYQMKKLGYNNRRLLNELEHERKFMYNQIPMEVREKWHKIIRDNNLLDSMI